LNGHPPTRRYISTGTCCDGERETRARPRKTTHYTLRRTQTRSLSVKLIWMLMIAANACGTRTRAVAQERTRADACACERVSAPRSRQGWAGGSCLLGRCGRTYGLSHGGARVSSALPWALVPTRNASWQAYSGGAIELAGGAARQSRLPFCKLCSILFRIL